MEAYPPTAADYAQAAADRANDRIKKMEESRGSLAPGMTLRDYFAARAPITMAEAVYIWGGAFTGLPHDDSERSTFMSVWAHLRYEWADAMLEARKA